MDFHSLTFSLRILSHSGYKGNEPRSCWTTNTALTESPE